MGCNNKKKYTCGDRNVNAKCVFFDNKMVPSESKLKEQDDCVTVEEVDIDQYKMLKQIVDTINLNGINPEHVTVEREKNKYNGEYEYPINKVVSSLTKDIFNIKESLKESETDDNLELDFKCLTTPCGQPITNLKDLLQAIINKICTDA